MKFTSATDGPSINDNAYSTHVFLNIFLMKIITNQIQDREKNDLASFRVPCMTIIQFYIYKPLWYLLVIYSIIRLSHSLSLIIVCNRLASKMSLSFRAEGCLLLLTASLLELCRDQERTIVVGGSHWGKCYYYLN